MAEENKKWKVEKAAGGVVYKIGSGPTSVSSASTQGEKTSAGRQIFILLIMGRQPDFGPPTGVWSFPKGHIDEGESDDAAALREVGEEGGVAAVIKGDLKSAKYFAQSRRGNIFKIVKYFLMEYVSGNPEDHDHEIAEAKWFELSEAEKALSYKTDKEVFERAKKLLEMQ